MASNNFTFITLNVQGLRNSRNRQTLFSWLNCAKPDIIALQETHSTSEAVFQTWLHKETQHNNNKQRYLVESSPGSNRSSGVAILYKPCFVIKKIQRDTSGRYLLLTFTHEDVKSHFQVLTVYGPNQQRPGEAFFASLVPEINPLFPIILCGDFNVVIDPHSAIILNLVGHTIGRHRCLP